MKFTNITQAHHLIDALKSKYEVSIDWTGDLYCSVTLNWSYKLWELIFHIPQYVKKLLTKYNHPPPK